MAFGNPNYGMMNRQMSQGQNQMNRNPGLGPSIGMSMGQRMGRRGGMGNNFAPPGQMNKPPMMGQNYGQQMGQQMGRMGSMQEPSREKMMGPNMPQRPMGPRAESPGMRSPIAPRGNMEQLMQQLRQVPQQQMMEHQPQISDFGGGRHGSLQNQRNYERMNIPQFTNRMY
jgi:hypothetical protein